MSDDTVEATGTSPRTEPGQKWIRGLLDGATVVDSRRSTLVWEIPYWPTWFFPGDDIAGELRESPTTPRPRDLPGVVRHDLVTGDRVLSGVARTYPDSPSAELRDLVALDWTALDRWFEEDTEVFTHPRSPYTRVDALPSSRHVVVSLDGVVLADSRKPTLLFETGLPVRYYLPAPDVRLDLLVASATRTSCPYKGDADFWSVATGDMTVDDVAWGYRTPLPESAPIAGLICFYNERVDIDVDGVREERPQTHFA